MYREGNGGVGGGGVGAQRRELLFCVEKVVNH